MGEITEALRRARAERARRVEPEPQAPPPAREPREDVYTASADRHRKEHADHDTEAPSNGSGASWTPSPPAPRPVPGSMGRAARAPRAEEIEPGAHLTHEREDSRAPQAVLIDGGGMVTDACLQLALRVRKHMHDLDVRTLVVVSALRDEGKTTVSCNLALALATLGHAERVALVDLDLRRPSLEKVLELPRPRCGIEDVIARGEPLGNARVHVIDPNIDVFPCLRGQNKAHEMLLRPGFGHVFQELRDAYDLVVFDSPPTLLVPDSTIIMQHVECFAPVARAGLTRARNFRKMLDTLSHKRMLGPIFDFGRERVRKGYYERYEADEAEEELETADEPGKEARADG